MKIHITPASRTVGRREAVKRGRCGGFTLYANICPVYEYFLLTRTPHFNESDFCETCVGLVTPLEHLDNIEL